MDIFTYGTDLLETGVGILDFNGQGISLVTTGGKVLWHLSLAQM
jgi:hypothetical protein